MYADVASLIKASKGIAILTGSGVSAESGIPTFRDAQIGLWEQYKPEELATQQAFSQNPKIVWDWYQWRRQLVAESQPNDAHNLIAQLQKSYPFTRLITQNVDGLHQAAGSLDVIEFHGNITTNKCNVCQHVEVNSDNSSDAIPHCPACNIMLRPGVVWFGESIPPRASKLSIMAVKNCDLFFSIGTSSQVHPAAGLADLARQNNATIVEINPNATPLSSSADFVFQESASKTLKFLAQHIF